MLNASEVHWLINWFLMRYGFPIELARWISTHPPATTASETGVVGSGPATRGTDSWLELYGTSTAHSETGVVCSGPATRGTDSWLELYGTSTANSETGVVCSGPATRGANSWLELYGTSTAHSETGVVDSGPATRGANSWLELYGTSTAHSESRVVRPSAAYSTTQPSLYCPLVWWLSNERRLKTTQPRQPANSDKRQSEIRLRSQAYFRLSLLQLQSWSNFLIHREKVIFACQGVNIRPNELPFPQG